MILFAHLWLYLVFCPTCFVLEAIYLLLLQSRDLEPFSRPLRRRIQQIPQCQKCVRGSREKTSRGRRESHPAAWPNVYHPMGSRQN